MLFENQLERPEWEEDEIVEQANRMRDEIIETIENLDRLGYVGSPEENSSSFVEEDGTLIIGESESFVDLEGNLVLN